MAHYLLHPKKSYFLGYEGGCIKFPIPEEYRHLYQNGTELPLEFPVRLTRPQRFFVSCMDLLIIDVSARTAPLPRQQDSWCFLAETIGHQELRQPRKSTFGCDEFAFVLCVINCRPCC